MAASPIMAILAVTGFLQSLGYYNHGVMLAKAKPHWQTALTLLYAVTNVAAFLLVSRYGLEAVALAFTVRTVVLYPISVGCAIRLLPIGWLDYARVTWPSIVCTAAMCAAVILVGRGLGDAADWERLLVLVPVGVCAYAIGLAIFGRKEIARMLAVSRIVFSRTLPSKGTRA
jgi:O-antigen/teichoic acid export membrane protein